MRNETYACLFKSRTWIFYYITYTALYKCFPSVSIMNGWISTNTMLWWASQTTLLIHERLLYCYTAIALPLNFMRKVPNQNKSVRNYVLKICILVLIEMFYAGSKPVFISHHLAKRSSAVITKVPWSQQNHQVSYICDR